MVNTPSLPVVVPHGDDDSNVYVLFAASSSGLQRWAVAAALHCATRQRTRLTIDAMTQTEPPARFLRRDLCSRSCDRVCGTCAC